MVPPPLADVVTICGSELATVTMEIVAGADSLEVALADTTVLQGEGFFFFGSGFFLLFVRTAAFVFGLTFLESDTIYSKRIDEFNQ